MGNKDATYNGTREDLEFNTGIIFFCLLVGGLVWQFVLPRAEAWGLSTLDIALAFAIFAFTFFTVAGVVGDFFDLEVFIVGIATHCAAFSAILDLSLSVTHPTLLGTGAALFLDLVVWPFSYALASGAVRLWLRIMRIFFARAA